MGALEAGLRDLPQPSLAHVGHVGAGGERAERVVGADVRGRLLAPDVLLTRRQRQHESTPARGVEGAADEPTRQPPHELLAAGDEPDVPTAVAGREPKLLALPDCDVRSVLAWRCEDGEAERLDAGDG